MKQLERQVKSDSVCMKTTFFPKDLAYRFSTLLVVAGCYLIMRFVITAAKVVHKLIKQEQNHNFYHFTIKKALPK